MFVVHGKDPCLCGYVVEALLKVTEFFELRYEGLGWLALWTFVFHADVNMCVVAGKTPLRSFVVVPHDCADAFVDVGIGFGIGIVVVVEWCHAVLCVEWTLVLAWADGAKDEKCCCVTSRPSLTFVPSLFPCPWRARRLATAERAWLWRKCWYRARMGMALFCDRSCCSCCCSFLFHCTLVLRGQ